VPETELAYVPETELAYVPETELAQMPETELAHVPETELAHVPETEHTRKALSSFPGFQWAQHWAASMHAGSALAERAVGRD